MVAAGYDRSYAMGVTAAGGTLGILIPPSIPLILYGFITDQSVVALFSATLVPGLLAVVSLLICAMVIARVKNYPRRPRAAMRSEEHTSELQSLMRISYAVFCLKQKQT